MTHKGFTFTYEPRGAGSNIVDTPGVDFSSRVYLVERIGEYAVLRIPAGKHWQGIGMGPATHPSQWLLVKIERQRMPARESLNGKAWERDRAVVVEAWEPGRKWREERTRLFHRARDLATRCECGGFYGTEGSFVHSDRCSPKKRSAFLKAVNYPQEGQAARRDRT